jgi:hypothetical protein
LRGPHWQLPIGSRRSGTAYVKGIRMIALPPGPSQMLYRALEVRSRPPVTCDAPTNTDLWIRSVIQQIAHQATAPATALATAQATASTTACSTAPPGHPPFGPAAVTRPESRFRTPEGFRHPLTHRTRPFRPVALPGGGREGRFWLLGLSSPAQRSGLDRRRRPPSDRSRSASPDLSAAGGTSPCTGRPRTCRQPQAEIGRCGTTGRPYVGSRASRTAGLRSVSTRPAAYLYAFQGVFYSLMWGVFMSTSARDS